MFCARIFSDESGDSMTIDFTTLKKDLENDAATTFIKAVREKNAPLVAEILKHDPDMELDGASLQTPKISLGAQTIVQAVNYAVSHQDYNTACVILDAAPRLLSYRNLGMIASKTVEQIANAQNDSRPAVNVLDQVVCYMQKLADQTPEITTFKHVTRAKNSRHIAQNFASYLQWNRDKHIMLNLKRLPWEEKLKVGAASLGNFSAQQPKPNCSYPPRRGH